MHAHGRDLWTDSKWRLKERCEKRREFTQQRLLLALNPIEQLGVSNRSHGISWCNVVLAGDRKSSTEIPRAISHPRDAHSPI